MLEIQPGKYKHYKGNLYEVLGCAIHSETHEKLVVYRMLYSSDTYPSDTLWARPLDMFLEKIDIGGKLIPRFEFIGES